MEHHHTHTFCQNTLAWQVRLLLGLSLLVLWPSIPQAQEYARWADSSRSMGMGGSGMADSTLPDAFIYNPAGLAQEEHATLDLQANEFASTNNAQAFFQKMEAPNFTSVGAANAYLANTKGDYYYLRKQGLGAYQYHGGFGVAAFEVDTRYGAPDTLNTAIYNLHRRRITGGMVSFATESKFRTFLFGVALKGVESHTYTEAVTGTTLATPGFSMSRQSTLWRGMFMDAGMIIRLPIPVVRPSLSVALLNGYNDSVHKFDRRSGLAPEVNVGLSMGPIMLGQGMKVVLSAEQRDAANFQKDIPADKKLNVGGEVSFFPLGNDVWGLQFRTGRMGDYASFGVGLNLTSFLRLSAAQYGEEIGTPLNPKKSTREVLEVRLAF